MNETHPGSPYRSHRRSRVVKKFDFYHRRFYFARLLGIFALLAASSAVTTPRTISVECRPQPDPAVECVSSARSFWGDRSVMRSRIGPSDHELSPSDFAAFEVEQEYDRRTKGESREFIRARFDAMQDWTAITETYPLSSGSLDAFFRFREQLSAGQPATLVYLSGWGGLLIAVPVAVGTLLLLWVLSGRSWLVYRVGVGDRIVETGSKSYWHSRARRRHLSRDDVEDAVVTIALDARGHSIHRVALKLGSGELVEFGVVATTPARPEHLVRQIRELLELPERRIVKIDVRDGPRVSR